MGYQVTTAGSGLYVRRLPASHKLVSTFAIGALLSHAALASAAESDAKLGVGLELGGGTMLSSYQRNMLGYDKDIQTTLSGSYRVIPPLDIRLDLRTWWFPSSQGFGRATLIGAGLRYWFVDGDVGAALVEGTLGAGVNGSNLRFMFDAAAGYAFHTSPSLDVGPVFRYGQVAAGGSDDPYSAKFWSLGFLAIYRFGGQEPLRASPSGPAGEPTSAPSPEKPATEKLADRDGDGVDDLHDACPDVPKGPKANPDQPGCPDGDFDKDGVVDHEDLCPAEPIGLHPDPAKKGCPLADRDGDSVPDIDDHCPDKAGAPSPDPKRNGCPGLAKVEAGKIQIKTPVFFSSNKDKILPKSFPVLSAVADALRVIPNIKRVDVQGHTDAQGKAERNLDLSQRRADSVRTWLVSHGVEPERLEAHGFGGERPVATNKTSKGRASNRRVEFLIIDPPPVAGVVRPE